jgi:hypothetical protein
LRTRSSYTIVGLYHRRAEAQREDAPAHCTLDAVLDPQAVVIRCSRFKPVLTSWPWPTIPRHRTRTCTRTHRRHRLASTNRLHVRVARARVPRPARADGRNLIGRPRPSRRDRAREDEPNPNDRLEALSRARPLCRAL